MVKVLKAKALYDCHGDEESELTFLEGDILLNVKETDEEGWLHGRLERTGAEGMFPDNYVELLHDKEPDPAVVPKLPTRSSPTVKSKELAAEKAVEPLSSNNAKPALPARQNTASSPLSSINSTKEAPSQPKRGLKSSPTSARVPLPGFATRPTPARPLDNLSAGAKETSTPPALPKRSNTIGTGVPSTGQESVTSPVLSVRERLATIHNQGARPIPSPAESQPSWATNKLGLKDGLHRSATTSASSPQSSTARPMLPPRNLTASPPAADTSTESGSKKHEYQVPDASVPVPKLTTFSRPRAARAKSATSPNLPSSTGGVIQPSGSASLTPPTLPARTPGPASTGSESGPVRFASAASRAMPEPAASPLPAISRNAHPLPLPSRTNTAATTTLNSGNTNGSTPHSTVPSFSPNSAMHKGINGSAMENNSQPVGSALGVKLNSVRPKPALPARQGSTQSLNTIVTPTTIVEDGTHSKSTDPLSTPPPLPSRSNTFSSAPSTPSSNSLLGTAASLTPTVQRSISVRQPPSSSATVVPKWSRSSAYDSSLVRQWGANSHGRGSNTSTPEPQGVKTEARKRYEDLFRSSCSSERIDGHKVHAIFVRSRLDSKTLAQIWNMVDVDNTGRLTKAQFCMGLYLIDERLSSGLIPLEVSDELWVSVMQ